MNIRFILPVCSLISMVLAVTMLPSIVVAHIYVETSAFYVFLILFCVFLLPQLLVFRFIKTTLQGFLKHRQVFMLVLFIWFITSFLASLPYYFTGVLPSFADAFFEGASGISTTGATVISNLDSSYQSVLLWRSITQWLGGMGIIVLTVALLPLIGSGASVMEIFSAEATGIENTKLTPRIAQTAKYLWIIYISFSLISFLLLLLGGMDAFSAANHAMSAISTGGFSTKNVGVGYYQSAYYEWVLIGTMLFSAISFGLYYRLFRGKVVSVCKNSELRAFFLILVCACVLVFFANYFGLSYESFEGSIRTAVFQTVSVMTTTGFATANYLNWPYLSQFILLVLIFIGGSSGSTSGGFKVVRLVVLFKQAINELRLLVHPKGIFVLRLNGLLIDKRIVYGVFGFFFLYLFSVTVVTAVCAMAGTDLFSSIATGFAIIGNTGSGFGQVGPDSTYAFYPAYVKWLLGIGMIAGRLELYTFFVLLTPYFWKK